MPLPYHRCGCTRSLPFRIETHDDKVARLRVYSACPDTVREVAAALGRPYGGIPMYHLPRAVIERLRKLA